MNFDMKYSIAKSAKQGDNEINVPVPIMVGVTVGLCGLFLFFVPLPGCQVAGGWLINTGVGILGADALNRWDEYDKNQKKRK